MGNTVPSLFAAIVGKDPSLPFLTFYDDATGERTELSGATLANWVSKTANLLVDGCGLGPGDTAAVRLPAHWQTAAILLGAWTAGLTVAYGEPTAAGADVEFASLSAAETGAPGPADRYVLGLAPMGLPMRGGVPDGWADYVAEVRQFGDHYPGPVGGAGTEDLVERARALGYSGSRLLVDAVAHPDPVEWLLGPLAAGASIVLSVNSDPAKLADRASAEGAAPV
ncbi:TIGR03089 family protein [Dactylosporangium vinaceum]|uniref:TIGR03089 family protein n=1 Tax=Dactylosporangium vinaceum TaxID=53362 RepID=A0ABV5LY43_9ACTN|nr:TIGR03089 family protein [Dactylosporangium vinaceum]UAB95792.1 TIGR03089 family protein [Dactylosporangium vinaceum]